MVKKVSIWQRLGRTIAIATAVVLSLLCFPHWLPWMVAFWLGWHSVQLLRGKPGYLPLATCCGILLVRLAPPLPLLLLMGFTLATVAFVRFCAPLVLSSRRVEWLAIVVVWLVWGLMFWEYRQAAVSSHQFQAMFDPTRPIVCIGDSLTQGMIPDRGYPGQLESMVRAPIVNEGVSGMTTSPAVAILERAMKGNPQVVIIELGGHDFLKWHSRSSTKANLVRMIEICRAHDAQVILMEIPRGFMVDPYASLERQIAYEYDLQLVDDRWLRHVVLMSPIAPPGRWLPKARHLSDDGIHSNEQGSKQIAEFVREALVELYGDQVLSKSGM